MKPINNKHPQFSEDTGKTWNGDFYFVQGADSQYGMISTYQEKQTVPNWEVEKQLSRICVNKINAMRPKPKFFVICGDLTDSMPDDEQGLIYKTQQEQDFIEIFSGLDKDIPLVCVCGNHDIGNQPSVNTVNRYQSVFGSDFYSFWVGGVMFLVLNSQYYFDGSLIPKLVKEQNDWLEARLEEAKSSVHSAVIFQHIPPFLREAEETDAGYFALPIDIRIPLLQKLDAAGVKYIFCGHYHRNAGGFYKDMEVITTSAIGCQLGPNKSGIRIVKVSNSNISHEYYSFEEVPEKLDT